MIERLRVRIPTGAAGEFSSPELTLCDDTYSVSVPLLYYHAGMLKTPVILPSVGVRLHINRHISLTQQSQSGLTMLLSRHSVGTYPETTSHTTCQGTFGHSRHSRLSSLSHRGSILA